MTDRELLELAAKAAGIDVVFREVIRSHIAEFQTIKHTRHSGLFLGGKEWNPLTDDGDALRLAVKLELDIYCADKVTLVCSAFHNEVGIEECGPDPYAATRRAIVRAAAEIGKEKQNETN